MATNKQYCIMRHEKYHRGRDNIKGLQAEQNREFEDEKYYNDIVFSEKSGQNKIFVYSDDFERDIDKVCEKYNVTIGEDSIVLIGTVYTASPEWFDQFEMDADENYTPVAKRQIEKYFLDCLDFHRNHYGVVISAHVHYDQTTPHLQVYSVPIVEVPTLHNYYVEAEEIERDGKKKKIPLLDDEGHEIRIRDDDCTEKEYKKRLKEHKCKIRKREYVTDENGNVVYHVSLGGARALGNAAQLSNDQTEFAQKVGSRYGLDRGEVTMGTPEHKTHRASLNKQLDDLEQKITESQTELADRMRMVLSVSADLDVAREKLESTQQAIQEKQQELEEVEEEIEAARDELEFVSEKWKNAKADIKYAAYAKVDADEYVEDRKEYAESIVAVAEENAKKLITSVEKIFDGYEEEYKEHLEKVYAAEQINGSTVEQFLRKKGLMSAYAAYVREVKEDQLREHKKVTEEIRNRRLEAAYKQLSVFKGVDIFMPH